MQLEPVVFRLDRREAAKSLALTIPGVFIGLCLFLFVEGLFADSHGVFTKISIVFVNTLFLAAIVTGIIYGVYQPVLVLRDRRPKLEFQTDGLIDHRLQRRIPWGGITHYEFSINSNYSSVYSAVIVLTVCNAMGLEIININLCGLSSPANTIYLKFLQYLVNANGSEDVSESDPELHLSNERELSPNRQLDTDETLYNSDKPAGWRALGIAVLIFASISSFLAYTTKDGGAPSWTGDKINLTGAALVAGIYYVCRALRLLCRFGPQLRLTSDGVFDIRTRRSFRWKDIENLEYLRLKTARRGWQKTKLLLAVRDDSGINMAEIDLRDLSKTGDEVAEGVDAYAAKYHSRLG